MNNNVKFMTTTALMTALLCILGPFSIPIGPVPISLTNFAIYIIMYVVGTKRGTVAYLLYLALGFAGLPVFSGFQGGPAKVVGPTGGYLIGFIPMAIVCGLVFKNHYKNIVLCVVTMEAATWIAYIMGSLWLSFQTHMTIPAAFVAGVFPFALEDFAKMVIAGIVGPVLVKALAPLALTGDHTKVAA